MKPSAESQRDLPIDIVEVKSAKDRTVTKTISLYAIAIMMALTCSEASAQRPAVLKGANPPDRPPLPATEIPIPTQLSALTTSEKAVREQNNEMAKLPWSNPLVLREIWVADFSGARADAQSQYEYYLAQAKKPYNNQTVDREREEFMRRQDGIGAGIRRLDALLKQELERLKKAEDLAQKYGIKDVTQTDI